MNNVAFLLAMRNHDVINAELYFITFLYCSVVYHYCSRRDIIKLEKSQKKGLRFVHRDFQSYTTLREKSNRPLLYIERQRCILQEVYKSIRDLGPRYLYG